jgi:hypothetical protein
MKYGLFSKLKRQDTLVMVQKVSFISAFKFHTKTLFIES